MRGAGRGIEVQCTFGSDACLRELVIKGHAAKNGSFSPACAHVSGIARSLGRLLLDAPGLELSGDLGAPGKFELQIRVVDIDQTEWLRGVSGLFRQAVFDAARDEPDSIQVDFKDENGG